jgi:hypothetical protein
MSEALNERVRFAPGPGALAVGGSDGGKRGMYIGLLNWSGERRTATCR